VRPGAAILRVQDPVGVRNRLRCEQPAIALRCDEARRGGAQALAIDPTVDDDVRHVDTLGAELARHALRDGAQAGLGRRERDERRLAAQRSRRAGEEDRTAAGGHHPTRRLAATKPPKHATRQVLRRTTPHLGQIAGRLLPALKTTISGGPPRRRTA
jgi:hypothetical protein